MEKFKVKVRNRSRFLVILFIAVVAVYLILLNLEGLQKTSGNITGFNAGMLTGFAALLCVDLLKYQRSMRNEEAFKKLYIEENDERSLMILQKTGAVGINLCIIGLAFGTIISGFFNETVFYTLLAATLFCSIIKASFKVYFHLNI